VQLVAHFLFNFFEQHGLLQFEPHVFTIFCVQQGLEQFGEHAFTTLLQQSFLLQTTPDLQLFTEFISGLIFNTVTIIIKTNDTKTPMVKRFILYSS